MNLREKVIRLAHANSELRKHLLPVLKAASKHGSSWKEELVFHAEAVDGDDNVLEIRGFYDWDRQEGYVSKTKNGGFDGVTKATSLGDLKNAIGRALERSKRTENVQYKVRKKLDMRGLLSRQAQFFGSSEGTLRSKRSFYEEDAEMIFHAKTRGGKWELKAFYHEGSYYIVGYKNGREVSSMNNIPKGSLRAKLNLLLADYAHYDGIDYKVVYSDLAGKHASTHESTLTESVSSRNQAHTAAASLSKMQAWVSGRLRVFRKDQLPPEAYIDRTVKDLRKYVNERIVWFDAQAADYRKAVDDFLAEGMQDHAKNAAETARNLAARADAFRNIKISSQYLELMNALSVFERLITP